MYSQNGGNIVNLGELVQGTITENVRTGVPFLVIYKLVASADNLKYLRCGVHGHKRCMHIHSFLEVMQG